MLHVTLFIATSLDGLIASPDGTVDWLFHDADYGYAEFFASLDAVVMGRKTYQQALRFEPVPFPGKKVFVFTRSTTAQQDGRIRFVQGEAKSVFNQITAEGLQNIWLVGGADIFQQFLEADLIDEMRLFVHPIVLGQGIPLFLPRATPKRFEHFGINSFPSGLVELKYRRQGAPSPQE